LNSPDILNSKATNGVRAAVRAGTLSLVSNHTAPQNATESEMWAAVARRDPGADGRFYYSVLTTGVYCKPSCAARRPRRENVAFHRDAAAAERAGFRPCKRCKPNQEPREVRNRALAERICRLIEQAEETPSLTALAEIEGLSPFTLQRTFKAVVGVTPKAYASALRVKRLRAGLRRGDAVTEALHDAGFGSSSRLYSQAGRLLGMRPLDFRAGGSDTEIRFAASECTLGSIVVAASSTGVCAILLGDDAEQLIEDLHDEFPAARLVSGDAEFDQCVAQVVSFADDPRIGLGLPLDIRGTAFQQRVWRALCEIPVGSTSSYSDIAAAIGAPEASRAVAQACARNRMAVAIPCHRVIRRDGSLSGYRWGVARKQALLEVEKSEASDG
jgi:AraC family transcriptional regulator of adaptative response/methylated-DNA-[protein]-cysteine methyltransferase